MQKKDIPMICMGIFVSSVWLLMMVNVNYIDNDTLLDWFIKDMQNEKYTDWDLDRIKRVLTIDWKMYQYISKKRITIVISKFILQEHPDAIKIVVPKNKMEMEDLWDYFIIKYPGNEKSKKEYITRCDKVINYKQT